MSQINSSNKSGKNNVYQFDGNFNSNKKNSLFNFTLNKPVYTITPSKISSKSDEVTFYSSGNDESNCIGNMLLNRMNSIYPSATNVKYIEKNSKSNKNKEEIEIQICLLQAMVDSYNEELSTATGDRHDELKQIIKETERNIRLLEYNKVMFESGYDEFTMEEFDSSEYDVDIDQVANSLYVKSFGRAWDDLITFNSSEFVKAYQRNNGDPFYSIDNKTTVLKKSPENEKKLKEIFGEGKYGEYDECYYVPDKRFSINGNLENYIVTEEFIEFYQAFNKYYSVVSKLGTVDKVAVIAGLKEYANSLGGEIPGDDPLDTYDIWVYTIDKYATKDELKIYSYLVQTNRYEEAEKYMSDLLAILHQRRGMAEAQEYINSLNLDPKDPNFGDRLRQYWDGFCEGFKGALDNIDKAVGATSEYTYLDIKTACIYQWFEENCPGLGTSRRRASMVGGIAPSIIASKFCPWLGTTMYATSTFGASLDSSLKSGANYFDSCKNAFLKTVGSVALERYLGRVPGLSTKYANNISLFAKHPIIASFILDIAGEGVEEYIQTYVDAVVDYTTIDKPLNLSELDKKAHENFVDAMIVSAIINAPDNGKNVYDNIRTNLQVTLSNGKTKDFYMDKVVDYVKSNNLELTSDNIRKALDEVCGINVDEIAIIESVIPYNEQITQTFENVYGSSYQLQKTWAIELVNFFETNNVSSADMNLFLNALLDENNLKNMVENGSFNFSDIAYSKNLHNRPKEFFEYLNSIEGNVTPEYLQQGIDFAIKDAGENGNVVDSFIKYVVKTNIDDLSYTQPLNGLESGSTLHVVCTLGGLELCKVQLEMFDDNTITFDMLETRKNLKGISVGTHLFQYLASEMCEKYPEKNLAAGSLLRTNTRGINFYEKLGAKFFELDNSDVLLSSSDIDYNLDEDYIGVIYTPEVLQKIAGVSNNIKLLSGVGLGLMRGNGFMFDKNPEVSTDNSNLSLSERWTKIYEKYGVKIEKTIDEYISLNKEVMQIEFKIEKAKEKLKKDYFYTETQATDFVNKYVEWENNYKIFDETKFLEDTKIKSLDINQTALDSIIDDLKISARHRIYEDLDFNPPPKNIDKYLETYNHSKGYDGWIWYNQKFDPDTKKYVKMSVKETKETALYKYYKDEILGEDFVEAKMKEFFPHGDEANVYLVQNKVSVDNFTIKDGKLGREEGANVISEETMIKILNDSTPDSVVIKNAQDVDDILNGVKKVDIDYDKLKKGLDLPDDYLDRGGAIVQTKVTKDEVRLTLWGDYAANTRFAGGMHTAHISELMASQKTNLKFEQIGDTFKSEDVTLLMLK